MSNVDESLDAAVWDTLSTTSITRLSWDVAPTKQQTPYAVVKSLPSLMPVYDSGSNAVEQRGYRVQIWAATRDEARQLRKEVRAALELRTIAAESGNVMQCTVASQDLFCEPDKGPDGELVFQGLIDFDLMFERAQGQ